MATKPTALKAEDLSLSCKETKLFVCCVLKYFRKSGHGYTGIYFQVGLLRD
jgi:hypothetical protein